MKKKVLVINTYGGSLLLAAKMAKMEVVASLEDVGFGSDIQALNFPKIPRYEKLADWPDRFPGAAWKDLIVIAHPPCSAFSNQNHTGVNRRGVGADAFACHKNVINYTLAAGCCALAIESVPGAYSAAEVYEQLADQYGYKTTYVMLNAVSFGVPQWRPRLWILFHHAHPFHVQLQPKYKLLRDVLDPDGTQIHLAGGPGAVKAVWERVRPLVKKNWPTGNILAVLQKVYGYPRDESNYESIRERFNIRGFTTSHVVFVNPNDFAGVILYDKTFAIGKRLLNLEEYCAIMGFPSDYKWGKREKQFRMYLSKGVCPSIGAWILKMLERNCSNGGWAGKYTHATEEDAEVLDLQPKRADALKAARKAAGIEVGE